MSAAREPALNGNSAHDSFSLFAVFFGVIAAVAVFVLLFVLAPILARTIGY